MSKRQEMLEINFTITRPKLPSTANGSHGHWTVKAAERRLWRGLTATEIRSKLSPVPRLTKIQATMIRHSAKEPDFDGLVHSFKPVVDGFVDSGLIEDDAPKFIERVYLWAKAKPGKGFIEVKIKEIA